MPGPAIRPVQRIVGVAGEHDVLGVYRAAEELHAVVQVVVNLHVLHRRGVADRLEGDAVQLVLRVHVGTGEAHAHVAQCAGVVVGVGTAEQTGVRLPFLGTRIGAAACTLRAVVDGRVPVDDQPAPQPAVAIFGVAQHFSLGGEENGLFRRAIGHQSATALDDEKVLIGGADQHRARSQRDLAIGQCPAAAHGGTFGWRDAGRPPDDLEHRIVAEHQTVGIDGAVAGRVHVDGVDGLVPERRAGRLAGLGNDVAQPGWNHRSRGGAARSPGAARVIVIVSATAIAPSAGNRHFHDDRARRHVLGRSASRDEHRDKRQRAEVQQPVQDGVPVEQPHANTHRFPSLSTLSTPLRTDTNVGTSCDAVVTTSPAVQAAADPLPEKNTPAECAEECIPGWTPTDAPPPQSGDADEEEELDAAAPGTASPLRNGSNAQLAADQGRQAVLDLAMPRNWRLFAVAWIDVYVVAAPVPPQIAPSLAKWRINVRRFNRRVPALLWN